MLSLKKTCFFFAVTLFLVQCSEQPAGKTPAKAAPTPAIAVFELSAALPAASTDGAANWCYGNYSQNLIVNAETLNTNRRYFYLPQGVTKLAVGPSGSSATVLLRPLANGNVEVFTGANFPHCLSSPENISPSGRAAILRYNNRKNIDFQMELSIDGGNTRITLEFNPGAVYAMSAGLCPDCQ